VSNSCIVAKITKIFGLNGAVAIQKISSIEKRIESAEYFYLDENLTEKIYVESIIGDKNSLRIHFKGYDSIEKSKALIGRNLYLERQGSLSIPGLSDFDLFYYEILDFEIEYLPFRFCKVSEIFENGSGLVYLSLIIENKEYLVPFSKDFIEKIDKKEKKIVLKRFEAIEPNNIRL